MKPWWNHTYMVRWEAEKAQCFACGRIERATLPVLDKEGWDWFTGYLPLRHMFCPHCIDSEQHMRALRKSTNPTTTGRRTAAE